METIELALKVITAVVAVTGGVVAIISLMQKWVSDRRTASWARLQWALDKTTSDNDHEQMLGWLMLDVLVKDEVKDRSDQAVAHSLMAYMDTIDVQFVLPHPTADAGTPQEVTNDAPMPQPPRQGR